MSKKASRAKRNTRRSTFNRAALEAQAASLIPWALGSGHDFDIASDLQASVDTRYWIEPHLPPVRERPEPIAYAFIYYLRNLDDKVIHRFHHPPDSPDFPTRYILGFLDWDTTPDERRSYMLTAHLYALSLQPGTRQGSVDLALPDDWDVAAYLLRHQADLSRINWAALLHYLRRFPFASTTFWRSHD